VRVTHDLCYKLRQTDVSSEYVRVLASEWESSVAHQKFGRADDPPRIAAPAYRHGDFGSYLRNGDLWDALLHADPYHTQVMLDVFDPIEIVLCSDEPERARARLAAAANRHDMTDAISGMPETLPRDWSVGTGEE
jgi:hypothetical protein